MSIARGKCFIKFKTIYLSCNLLKVYMFDFKFPRNSFLCWISKSVALIVELWYATQNVREKVLKYSLILYFFEKSLNLLFL